MKKAILAIGLGAMLTGLTACGGNSEKKSDSDSDYEIVEQGEEVTISDDLGGGDSSSSSSDESSFSSSSDESSLSDQANINMHDAIDEAHDMINEELDKHGVAGKAAKLLYDKSAQDLHDALDELDSDDGADW
ncbi:MAG: hypothetical protein HDS53_04375 [Barnesiella sp.]|nr:hypothetical protein [Barnesiella sp.]